MGGTFMSMPEDYRNAFVAQLHNALSGFTGVDVDEAVRYVVMLCRSILIRTCPAGTLSKANPRLLESPSRRGQITA